jgi:hypothetical protein
MDKSMMHTVLGGCNKKHPGRPAWFVVLIRRQLLFRCMHRSADFLDVAR